MKIKNKILTLTLGLLLISILMFTVTLTYVVQMSLTDDVVQNRLLNDKKVVDEFIRYSLKSYNRYELEKASITLSQELRNILGLRVSIYDKSLLLADSSGIQEEMPVEVTHFALNGENAYTRSDNYIYFAFPVKNIGAVRLAYPMSLIDNVIENIQLIIISTGILIFIIAMLTATYFSDKLSQPIIMLNEQVKRISDGNYNTDLTYSAEDEIGELTYSIGDMSNTIKKSIEQLSHMVENEKKLKEMQRSFTNNVTHEFKTPLTSIIGYSDLLKQYSKDPELLENAASTIKSEGERLLLMVEKLLYLSRLEYIDKEIVKEEINISDLINDCIEAVKLKAMDNKILISSIFQWEGTFLGDYEMLYSMLVNILDNAIKYNKTEGKVYVKVFKQHKYLSITIRDTGIGIDDENTDKLYEAFYRIDKNRSRKIGGSGLGLSIVKEIVDLHKGRISIKGIKEKGTTITVLLPGLNDERL